MGPYQVWEVVYWQTLWFKVVLYSYIVPVILLAFRCSMSAGWWRMCHRTIGFITVIWRTVIPVFDVPIIWGHGQRAGLHWAGRNFGRGGCDAGQEPSLPIRPFSGWKGSSPIVFDCSRESFAIGEGRIVCLWTLPRARQRRASQWWMDGFGSSGAKGRELG